jgi:hypothetical protein
MPPRRRIRGAEIAPPFVMSLSNHEHAEKPLGCFVLRRAQDERTYSLRQSPASSYPASVADASVRNSSVQLRQL